MINYVKFLRGTPTAYQGLETKDHNTLYFISEEEANTGSLYLGDKLISGSLDLTKFSIKDLKDVNINGETLVDGQILVYDFASKQWVNKTVSEIAAEAMKGATADKDGTAGLVPAPKAGQQNLFLRGDGTWAEAGETADITELRATVATLVGTDASQSVRQIATGVLTEALIPEGAKESLDTLQEIAAWIQQHPDDATAMNGKITVLQEKVGTLEGEINTLKGQNDNFVEKTVYAAEVGDLTQLSSHLADSSSTSTIVDEINSLNQRLEWQELK